MGKVGLLSRSIPVDTGQSTATSLSVVSVEDVAADPVNALSATELTRSGCPRATSAGAPLAVGILSKIRTRLKPRSVTKSRVPSEVTDTGVSMVLAAAPVNCWVMSGLT